MSDMIKDNLLTFVLGGGNLWLIIKFFIDRHDAKVEKQEDKIKSTLKRLEKDGIRTQLLLLMLLLPAEKKEILTLGQYYFSKPPKGLDGNWYMTSLFDKWIVEHNSGVKPEWFKSE